MRTQALQQAELELLKSAERLSKYKEPWTPPVHCKYFTTSRKANMNDRVAAEEDKEEVKESFRKCSELLLDSEFIA